MSEKRFNVIDDEWIGLSGAEFVTAIEDSDSPKKAVYFVHNHNVKGIADLLNEQNKTITRLKKDSDSCSHNWALLYDEAKNKVEELHEENQELKKIIKSITEDYNDLKQSNEDARQMLKKEFDFATEQRQKHLDDPVVANAYDIIRYDMRRALDKLGGYDD